MGAWRPQMNYHFKELARVSSRRENSNLGPFRPIPLAASDAGVGLICAHRHFRARSGGFGATAHDPDIVAVSIAATAGLSFHRRGLSREVSRARKNDAGVCV